MKNALIVISIVCCVGACKKDTLDTFNEDYTIEGTMYDKDGKTPLPNYPLILLAEVQHNFSQSTTEQVAAGSTDANGYFKLTYKGNDDYAYLDIGQPANKLPVRGPFLLYIPANKNVSKDICVVNKGVVEIKIEPKINLTDKDTVFVWALLPKPLNDSIHAYPNEYGAPLDIYMYTKSSNLENNTWVIETSGPSQFNGGERVVRWGKGRANFDKALLLESGEESNSAYFMAQKYPWVSFPDTTRVVISVP